MKIIMLIMSACLYCLIGKLRKAGLSHDSQISLSPLSHDDDDDDDESLMMVMIMMMLMMMIMMVKTKSAFRRKDSSYFGR